MDAVTYLKIEKRLCDGMCKDCPLSSDINGTNLVCTSFAHNNPEKAVELLEKWEKEHPQRTYMQDFLEKHPNAQRYTNEEPCACRCEVYGGKCPSREAALELDCIKCWNEPMEE